LAFLATAFFSGLAEVSCRKQNIHV
jgi:hypothetical protein